MDALRDMLKSMIFMRSKTAEPDLTETVHWYKPLWISICFIENDFLRLVINTEDTVCPS